jgi:hypothetical protein
MGPKKSQFNDEGIFFVEKNTAAGSLDAWATY